MIGQLTGIITKRGPRKFTARCLELEIDSEGTSADEAKNRLINAVQQHIDSLAETREQRVFVSQGLPYQDKAAFFKDSIVFEMPNHLILH